MERLIILRALSEDGREGRLERLLAVCREAAGGSALTLTGRAGLAGAPEGSLHHKKILIAASVGGDGINLDLMAMEQLLRRRPDLLAGSVCGLLIDGEREFYTKAAARDLAVSVLEGGGSLIGRPLVEATGTLRNYIVQASRLHTGREEALAEAARDLTERLLAYREKKSPSPRILCLHASNVDKSNTYALWTRVRACLPEAVRVREISLWGLPVMDCNGCSYEACSFFSGRKTCYYGGPIPEEVYPALMECDALVLLCPNYNDALGAGLTALINRLTALYRRQDFSDKYVFALVVSGYSGGDILVRQLIGSLGMNKAFRLPSGFVLSETASAPGSLLALPGTGKKAAAFAGRIRSVLLEGQEDAD